MQPWQPVHVEDGSEVRQHIATRAALDGCHLVYQSYPIAAWRPATDASRVIGASQGAVCSSAPSMRGEVEGVTSTWLGTFNKEVAVTGLFGSYDEE